MPSKDKPAAAEPTADAPVVPSTMSREELKRWTETVRGGKYVVNGRYVDANGEDLGPAPAQTE